MDLGLRNKVSLVTGGASGIGAAVVRMLVSEGARVAFVDRNENEGAKLVAEFSASEHKPRYIRADLTNEADCGRCVVEALGAFHSGLDILINNAGVNDAIGLE